MSDPIDFIDANRRKYCYVPIPSQKYGLVPCGNHTKFGSLCKTHYEQAETDPDFTRDPVRDTIPPRW
jgi:hypothetical protein